MADQPPSQVPHYDYRDDEISLYELWNTLVKHRLVIAVVFVVCVAAASVFALTRTPVYVMDAVVEVGVMPTLNAKGLQSIASPDEVVSRAVEVIVPRLRASNQLDSAEPGLPAVDAEVLDAKAGLIRLYGETAIHSADRFSGHLKTVLDTIIQGHNQDLERRTGHLERRANQAQEELTRVLRANQSLVTAMDAAQSADKSSGDNIASLNRQLASTLSSIVGSVISQNASTDVTAIRNSIAQFEAAANNLKPTQVVRAPALADSPEGQPAATLIALGGVLGLLLGMLSAFGREFLANAAAQSDAT